MFILRTIIRFYFRLKINFSKKYWTWRVSRSCASYKHPLKVQFKSKVTSKTHLGKNVSFNGMQITGHGKVTIGDNFHSGKDCKMITQIHNYEGGAIPYDHTYIIKDIIIEDNVWLGDQVILLGGVTIGEGAIIQAGSVVVSSIPKCGIAGGHPAKVFKYRNEDHYYRLKLEGKFH